MQGICTPRLELKPQFACTHSGPHHPWCERPEAPGSPDFCPGRGQRAEDRAGIINKLAPDWEGLCRDQPQANRNRTFQECHPKASLPLTPGLFPSPDFILLVCVGLPPGSPGSASPARYHLAADICLGCHQRRSQHVGDGPGIRMASSAPSPAPPCSPKLRPAKASVWGAWEDPCLATHSQCCPSTPFRAGRSPEGREPGASFLAL